MTFSIVAIDSESGACGAAVASFSLAVGGTVSYSRIGVGVINTQHCAHFAVLRGDPEAESRQLIVMRASRRAGPARGQTSLEGRLDAEQK